MKKIKLLTALSSLPVLGMATIPLTSCGNKDKTSISKIEIANKPTKLFYKAGDKLNLTGMVVIAINLDGTTKDVTSQCTTNPDTKTPLTENHSKVVVTHTLSGKTCEFNIEVGIPAITSITVTTLPSRTVYCVGDKLNLTGMVVKANWNDGREPTDVTTNCVTVPGIDKPLTKEDTKIRVAHITSGKICEFNITVIDKTFQNDSWENVITYANQGLAKLKEVYGVSTFIGLERTITINNYEHTVRVIGEEHDTIADTNVKAALTFELVTLLSSNDGSLMFSKWDTTNNNDYTNSVLRKNLTGEGSATGEKVWSNNAFSMLPLELQNAIKNVSKQVATKVSPAVEYTITTYKDKLFPLTHTEMAQQPIAEQAKEEGTAYKYWIDHNNDQDRIKKGANGTAKHYWLVSPDIGFAPSVWGVDFGGGFCKPSVSAPYDVGVSFGFCI